MEWKRKVDNVSQIVFNELKINGVGESDFVLYKTAVDGVIWTRDDGAIVIEGSVKVSRELW